MHYTNPTCYATGITYSMSSDPAEISSPIICTWIIVVSATPFVAAPPSATARTVLCLNEYSLLIYEQYGLTGPFFVNSLTFFFLPRVVKGIVSSYPYGPYQIWYFLQSSIHDRDRGQNAKVVKTQKVDSTQKVSKDWSSIEEVALILK